MAAGSGDRSSPCVRPRNKFGPLRPGFTLSIHDFRPTLRRSTTALVDVTADGIGSN